MNLFISFSVIKEITLRGLWNVTLNIYIVSSLRGLKKAEKKKDQAIESRNTETFPAFKISFRKIIVDRKI